MFIKLTIGESEYSLAAHEFIFKSMDKYLYINPKHIGHFELSFNNNWTDFVTRNGRGFYVKETPEQIMEMFKEEN